MSSLKTSSCIGGNTYTCLFPLSTDDAVMADCFSPTQTHEEPVTELVAHEVTSYRQLPLRLYQVPTT